MDEDILLPQLDSPQPGQEEVYLTAALAGTPVVEHGCVKIADALDGEVRTVLWHSGTELDRDRTGYLLRNSKTGSVYRFGQAIEFGGGEMPLEWAEQQYPEVAARCGPPYASGWLPK